MAEADMLYPIHKTPVYADIAGTRVEVPGKFAVVRGETKTDDAAFIGIVGKEYEPIQNEQVANAIDRSGLLASGQYQVETVGALGDGERVFMALSDRTGEFSIAGSPARNYWTVYNGHDGNLALGLMQTPVKVVCSNTLVMALASSSINVKVQHTKAAELDLEFWLNLAPRMRVAEERTRQVIASMVDREVNEEEVDASLAAAYPTPKEVGKSQLHALKALLNVSGTEAQCMSVMPLVSWSGPLSLRASLRITQTPKSVCKPVRFGESLRPWQRPKISDSRAGYLRINGQVPSSALVPASSGKLWPLPFRWSALRKAGLKPVAISLRRPSGHASA